MIDSSPTAVNMAYNLLNHIDMKKLDKEFKKLVSELEHEINDIYYTKSSDGYSGYAEVIIASNIYSCPNCNNEIILHNNQTGVRSEYKCQNCGELINISKNEIKERLLYKRKPVEVRIKITDKSAPINTELRPITQDDIDTWEEKLNEYNEKYGHYWAPSEKIVYNRCYPRVGGWPGFPIDSTVSDLFPPNNLLALKMINHYIENKIEDKDIKSFIKFVFLETLFRTSSRLFTSSGIKNVYHIPPVGKEQNVLTVFQRKYRAIIKGKNLTEHGKQRIS